MRPEFVRLIQRTDPPQVVILSDSSGSMLTRDIVSTNDIITRADWLEAQTKRAFWKPLEPSSEVLTGAFAAPPDLTSTNALNQVREIGTDLSGALGSVLGQQKNLKAVLLLSDGDWNLGPSPIGIATRYRDQGIPVYSVVTGQDESIPDLAMEEVAAPAYGLFGEQIAIPYTVQSHLPRDVATEVRLMQGTEQLAAKKITLPANSRFRDSIMWYPREVGEFDLRLEFPVEPDEGLRDNNCGGVSHRRARGQADRARCRFAAALGISISPKRSRPRPRRGPELHVISPEHRHRRRARLPLRFPRFARNAVAL